MGPGDRPEEGGGQDSGLTRNVQSLIGHGVGQDSRPRIGLRERGSLLIKGDETNYFTLNESGGRSVVFL